MEICKKIRILLVFSVVVVVASAHSTYIYLLHASPDKVGKDNFLDLGRSFKNFWSGLLGDFGALDSIENDVFASAIKIAYSFFINIVILNILSNLSINPFLCQYSVFFSNTFLTFFSLDSCTRKSRL